MNRFYILLFCFAITSCKHNNEIRTLTYANIYCGNVNDNNDTPQFVLRCVFEISDTGISKVFTTNENSTIGKSFSINIPENEKEELFSIAATQINFKALFVPYDTNETVLYCGGPNMLKFSVSEKINRLVYGYAKRETPLRKLDSILNEIIGQPNIISKINFNHKVLENEFLSLLMDSIPTLSLKSKVKFVSPEIK